MNASEENRFYVLEGKEHWIVMDHDLMRWHNRISKSDPDAEQLAINECVRLNATVTHET